MNCDLILALDCETADEAAPLLRQLSGRLRWVKIGLQMFTAYGPDYVRRVADQGFNVFLDLKLNDIPNTVAKAVQSLAPLPIGMLTLHTSGGREMMEWAVKAQRQHKPDLLLLGVTVLTSMDDAALNATGVPGSAAAQVERLARLAATAGMTGLVCSPHEVAPLRAALPAGVQLVRGAYAMGLAAEYNVFKKIRVCAELNCKLLDDGKEVIGNSGLIGGSVDLGFATWDLGGRLFDQRGPRWQATTGMTISF